MPGHSRFSVNTMALEAAQRSVSAWRTARHGVRHRNPMLTRPALARTATIDILTSAGPPNVTRWGISEGPRASMTRSVGRSRGSFPWRPPRRRPVKRFAPDHADQRHLGATRAVGHAQGVRHPASFLTHVRTSSLSHRSASVNTAMPNDARWDTRWETSRKLIVLLGARRRRDCSELSPQREPPRPAITPACVGGPCTRA